MLTSSLSFSSFVPGSSHGPLKPSLKKPYLGERGSVTSEGSAKHVKLSIGGEQTAV
ncbi:Putative LOC101900818 [Caligus rogercresseyi]|uniref:LOC101900818 n=1 Tax=Caligus rogercresseyi TaxID=217165 RepID=A0A7T8JUJ1_CALRO|nr:Putative LOC101900818 [Caligus rogercresseyi]QQP35559.1 Putative LOC101900818 [Caligus rogercresseyi]